MPMPSWLLRVHQLSRLPRLTQLPLGVEITMLLVIKISLLFVLARLCFAEPQAKHMRMPTALVEQHLLAPAAPSTTVCAAPANCTGLPDSPHQSTAIIEVTHASH
jgi:hypothetical protein